MQKNDLGTVFEITCLNAETGAAIDLSAATTKQFIFKAPSAATLTVNALFSTDGKDGKIKYVTTTSDIDEAGDWAYQGYLTWATGERFYSPQFKIKVGDNVA